MDVSAITNNTANTYTTPVAAQSTSAPVPEVQNENKNEAAVFEKGSGETYKVDHKAVKAAIAEMNNSVERFRQLVEKLFGIQANTALKAGGMQWSKEFWESLEVDEETRLQAQEEIGEDGYFGVKQTSERLLNFAKAISGGDPSKIGLLREAVQAGFDEAEKMWGDKLPEISYKTLEAVMKGFDEWEASATAAKNE